MATTFQRHIAVAVEGVSWSSPDFYPMLVTQSIFSNWDHALGYASLLSPRLSDIIMKLNLANSYMSFSTSNSDTGLWGIYLVSENLANLDDVMHFMLREWPVGHLAALTSTNYSVYAIQDVCGSLGLCTLLRSLVCRLFLFPIWFVC